MKKLILIFSLLTLIASSCGQVNKKENNLNNNNKSIENMNFRVSFCDPLKPDIIEIGNVEKGKIMELFDKIPWSEHLEKMKTVKDNEIYYSPSLEIENKDNRNGIVVSAIDGKEWYVFYKRPKRIKVFFGLFERMNNNYLTEVHGQTENDARSCLEALIRNDLQFLENKIK